MPDIAVVLNYPGGGIRWAIIRMPNHVTEINYPPDHYKVGDDPDEDLKVWYREWFKLWRRDSADFWWERG